MAINIIDIRNATVYRGACRVFSRLTLTIPEGCHTAILGPNGSGKTTLLKLLSREVYPLEQEGSCVRVFGQSRWNVCELRRHLGIVSSDLHPDSFPHSTALDVVLSGYYSSQGVYEHQHFSAGQRERAREAMTILGIDRLAQRPVSTLSAGEARRALLARALIHDPRALLLDEPTVGLDLHARAHYLALLEEILRRGKTIVLVTHHLDEIPPAVARVVFLKHGTIIADGPKEQLFTEERLSGLFDVPVRVLCLNNLYHVIPLVEAAGA